MAFNVGDIVENIYCGSDNYGKRGTVTGFSTGKHCTNVIVRYWDGSRGESGGYHPELNYYKLITRAENNKAVAPKMSLIAKLMLSLKSEPEKSSIKTGVKNADGTFTCEGKELFINWLSQDTATYQKFFTEVVQPLAAEMEKEVK